MFNGLYLLIDNTISGTANAVLSKQETTLWHKRLGHIGNRGLKELSKKEVFGPISKLADLDFCDGKFKEALILQSHT